MTHAFHSSNEKEDKAMDIQEHQMGGKVKKSFAFLGSFILMLLITYVDYVSGIEVHLTVLLLIPVYFATWYSSFTGGALLSLLGASSLIMDPLLERKIYPQRRLV